MGRPLPFEPRKPAVRERSRVNVKATTAEGLGALGRGEGVAAHAVVLLLAGDSA